jgi:hypothetical protein
MTEELLQLGFGPDKRAKIIIKTVEGPHDDATQIAGVHCCRRGMPTVTGAE